MRGKLLLISLLVIFSLSFVSAETCSVKTSCLANETSLLLLSGETNAHAALASSGVNYTHKLCCSVGNGSKTFLKLSSTTNAHVQQNNETFAFIYPQNATIDANSCNYANSCTTGQGFECVLSISNETNAHTGNCSAYSSKVCCKFGPADPSGGGGNSGRSSGGGGSTGSEVSGGGALLLNCGEWSNCSSTGIQRRICTNNENTFSRNETRACTYISPEQPAVPGIIPEIKDKAAQAFNFIKFLVRSFFTPFELLARMILSLFF